MGPKTLFKLLRPQYYFCLRYSFYNCYDDDYDGSDYDYHLRFYYPHYHCYDDYDYPPPRPSTTAATTTDRGP